MQSNLFRYLKTLLSKTKKPFILAIFVLSVVLSVTSITNAQSFTNADLELKYDNFINLFTTTTDTKVVSGISAIKPNKFLDKDGVNGFVFNVNVGIDTSKKNAEWHWDRTQTGSGDKFLIQICDPSNKCWLESLTVEEKKSSSDVFAYRLFKKIGNTYVDRTSAAYTLFDGTSRAYKYDRATNTVSTLTSLPVMIPGSTITATLWYCASDDGEDPDEDGRGAKNLYDTNSLTDQRVTKFGTLCDGNTVTEGTYFRIGTPQTYTIPKDQDTLNKEFTAGEQNKQGLSSGSTDTSGDTNLPVCSIDPISKGSIVGCLAQLAYYGIYTPISWVAGLFGTLFDFFIGFSVSDETYRMGFAVTGWKLVRDIANIFFIIIMIYTGFSAVFSFGGAGGQSMKRIIPFLIINALIINFSLFATRTVIDISNITARVFYSRMIVCDGACEENVPGTSIPRNVKRSPLGGHWPLSEKIVASFDPQKMFSTSVLNPKEAAPANSASDPLQNSTSGAKVIEAQAQAKGFDRNSTEYAGYFAVVSIIAAIIMGFIGIMFFKVMFIFVGRVMGLYMAMIFSPFAFLTLNGAGGAVISNKMDLFEWKSWSKDLFGYAALAPVFTFMLYIVYSFLNTDMVKEIGLKDPTGGFFGTVLLIAVPMIIIYFLIDMCAQTAKKFSGKFGDMAQKTITGALGTVAGGALGVAGGAAAFLGTGLGARAGKAIGSSGVGSWAANNADSNRAARFFNNTLSKTQTGSWDFRNTKLNGLVGKGINTATGGQVTLKDTISNRVGLQTDKFKDGAVGRMKAREKEIKNEIENKVQYAHLSDDRAKEVWERHQNKKVKEQAVKDHAYETNIEYKAVTDKVDSEKKDLKKKREEIAEAKRTLVTQSSTLTTDQKTVLNTTITNSTKDVDKILKTLAEAKATQAAQLGTTKATLNENDPAYQAKVTAATKDRKEKDLTTYGEIKNTGDLTNAMRRDYVEDKRNNSLWMKDGEQRTGMGGIGLGAGAAGMLAGLSTAVGLGASYVIADRIKFEQEAFDNATKDYIKDYGKKKGKESKTEVLRKKTLEYEETLRKSIVANKAKNNITSTDDEIKEEIKNMDNDKKDEHITEYMSDLEADVSITTADFKNAEEAYRKNKDVTTESLFKQASKKKKQAEDTLSKAKNAKIEKDKAEAEVQKEKNTPK